MQYTDKDLEALVELLLTKISPLGISENIVRVACNESIAELNQRKANDVSEMYKALQPDSWYIESFQQANRQKGNPPADNMRGTFADWKKVYEQVNARFNTNLSDENRGRDQVYVWLEKDATEKGILHSYGEAHFDASRPCMHYFVVAGNYDLLSRVADSFVANPKNLSAFTKTVFDWKNNPPAITMDEPDLFICMNQLYVSTPQSGIQEIKVR